MIASWVTQVSGDPVMVGAAIKKGRRTLKVLDTGKKFTLALLGENQADIMDKFKGQKEIDNGAVNGVPYKLADNGAPVPEQCVGYIELTLEGRLSLGNHVFCVGRVTNEVLVDGGHGLSVADLHSHVYRGV
jgi:flavin reductase (DIM6/NTAB) family NADH-FMN oxidoreductase RutF